MKSSPIYNIVINPGRKSDCSFGVSNRFAQEIRVGTSANNSHKLATISVEKFEMDDGTVKFNMWLDGMLIRFGTLDGQEFDLQKVG